jgi:hypothetical protein
VTRANHARLTCRGQGATLAAMLSSTTEAHRRPRAAPVSRAAGKGRRRLWGVTAMVALVAAAYQAEARSDGRAEQPLSVCSEACDHHASDCIDRCEDQFKDDKPRVQCKLACIAAREKCATDCH